jgi:hypothetical protein
MIETAPPKTKHHRFIAAIAGIAVATILALIALLFFSEFPGPPIDGGETTKSHPPAEDVTR